MSGMAHYRAKSELRDLSFMTGRSMTDLLDEATMLLAEKYRLHNEKLAAHAVRGPTYDALRGWLSDKGPNHVHLGDTVRVKMGREYRMMLMAKQDGKWRNAFEPTVVRLKNPKFKSLKSDVICEGTLTGVDTGGFDWKGEASIDEKYYEEAMNMTRVVWTFPKTIRTYHRERAASTYETFPSEWWVVAHSDEPFNIYSRTPDKLCQITAADEALFVPANPFVRCFVKGWESHVKS